MLKKINIMGKHSWEELLDNKINYFYPTYSGCWNNDDGQPVRGLYYEYAKEVAEEAYKEGLRDGTINFKSTKDA